MAVGDEVRVSYVADIAGLKAQLAAAGSISASETRQIIANLEKIQKARLAEARAANALAKGAVADGASVVKSTGAVRAGYVNLGNQLSDVASQLSTGTNPMTILIQQGPQAAGALGMMGAAAGPVALAIAAVGTAAAAGYLTWRIYNEDAQRAADVAKEVAAAHQALTPILNSTRDASIDLAESLGYVSEEEAKLEHNSIRAFGALQAATAPVRRQIQELEADQRSMSGVMSATLQEIVPAWTPLGKIVDALTTSTEEYDTRISALRGTIIAANEATEKNVATTANLISADIAAKDAKKALTDATKAQTEAVRAAEYEWSVELDRVKSLSTAWDKLTDIRDAAHQRSLRGVEAVNEALRQQLVEVDALQAQATEAGLDPTTAAQAAADARVALEAEAAEKIAEIRAKEAEDAARAAEKAKRDVERAKKEQIAAIEQSVSSVTRIAEGAADAAGAAYDHQADAANKLREQLVSGDAYYTDEQRKQLKDQVKAHENAARRAWQIEHGVALGVATTNMFLAIGKAAASAPWPLNLIPMAGAAASTAPLVASVAAQKPAFHSGRAPDEIDATILRKEAVMSPQGVATMGGPEAVRQMNAGVSQGSGSVILSTTVYRHGRQTTRIKADGLKRRDPIARAIYDASPSPYLRGKG